MTVNEEASTRPLTQPEDDTSTNIARDTSSAPDAKTGAEAEMSNSEGDTEILNVDEEKDLGNTFKSRPLPDEDQAGSNPRQSHVALVGPDPKPMHEDFIATVYPKVYESLKHTTEEHVFLEKPKRSSGTLSSMKNKDDAFTYGDQFLNDKLTEEEPCKSNVETKVDSMVSIPIHQAFSTVPPLSTLVINLTQPKPASMYRENREEFMDATTKSRKRSRNEQDPSPPPSKDSDQNDTYLSNSEDTDADHLPQIKTRPDWLKPIPEEEMPKTPKPQVSLLLTDKIGLTNPEGNRVVLDVSKPLPLGGPPDRRHTLSISNLKAAYYQDFRLEELISSLWIESERQYDVSADYGISHWWFKSKAFYITKHSASSDRRAVRSHIKILNVISLMTFSRYSYTFLREIVLRRANYKEYNISKADFKNLHLNDFEDQYLLHLHGNLNNLSSADKVHLFNAVNLWIRNLVIRKHVEDLQLRIKSYQMKINLTQPN
nr:hypothetical protein [Tanacetum cinerariifolium]